MPCKSPPWYRWDPELGVLEPPNPLHGEADAPPQISVSGSHLPHQPSGLCQGWIFRDCRVQGTLSHTDPRQESPTDTPVLNQIHLPDTRQ